jgi:exocyst complex component 2
MYDALMYLVSVHANLSRVATSLLDRALFAIVEIVATECLACFKQIPRFGMGGMLRVSSRFLLIEGSNSEALLKATLEIEFMHQTIAIFTTDNKAQAILVEVYNSISQSYVRRPGDDQVQTHLDSVKKTLAEARKSTGIAFMCFRQTKGDGEKSSRKDRDSAESTVSGNSTPQIPPPPTPRSARRREKPERI